MMEGSQQQGRGSAKRTEFTINVMCAQSLSYLRFFSQEEKMVSVKKKSYQKKEIMRANSLDMSYS